MSCPECGEAVVPTKGRGGKNKKFCTLKCQNRAGVRRRRIAKKDRLVEILGGACKDCGVVGPSCIYDLHHRDPGEKDVEIGKLLRTRPWDEILREAMKCDLLCSNCHRIRHYKGV